MCAFLKRDWTPLRCKGVKQPNFLLKLQTGLDTTPIVLLIALFTSLLDFAIDIAHGRTRVYLLILK